MMENDSQFGCNIYSLFTLVIFFKYYNWRMVFFLVVCFNFKLS